MGMLFSRTKEEIEHIRSQELAQPEIWKSQQVLKVAKRTVHEGSQIVVNEADVEKMLDEKAKQLLRSTTGDDRTTINQTVLGDECSADLLMKLSQRIERKPNTTAPGPRVRIVEPDKDSVWSKIQSELKEDRNTRMLDIPQKMERRNACEKEYRYR
jgi:cell division protein FtsX